MPNAVFSLLNLFTFYSSFDKKLQEGGLGITFSQLYFQKAAGTQEAFDKYMLSEQMTLFLQASQFGSPRTWYVPGRMKVRWVFDLPVPRAIKVFTKEIKPVNPKGNQS